MTALVAAVLGNGISITRSVEGLACVEAMTRALRRDGDPPLTPYADPDGDVFVPFLRQQTLNLGGITAECGQYHISLFGRLDRLNRAALVELLQKITAVLVYLNRGLRLPQTQPGCLSLS